MNHGLVVVDSMKEDVTLQIAPTVMCASSVGTSPSDILWLAGTWLERTQQGQDLLPSSILGSVFSVITVFGDFYKLGQ